MAGTMHVDLSPIKTFRYIQIPNHDFTFILLDENLKAIHSAFQCKDYLQDIFYCEYTGESAEIWGIYWTQNMLNMNTKRFKMALSGGKVQLENQVKTMKSFLNFFDVALDIPKTRVYNTDDPKIIVVDFHKSWTENGPLLSAFTTAIRLSGLYKEGDPIEYLTKIRGYIDSSKRPSDYMDYMLIDIQRLPVTLGRFAALLEGKKPEHSWSDFKDIHAVHDTGIVGFGKFPTVSVKI
jgi:hypothetical protein